MAPRISKLFQNMLLLAALAFALVASSPTAVDTPIDGVDGPTFPAKAYGTEVVVSHLPGGRLRYNFYREGTLELYVEDGEDEDGSVSAHDAGGAKISLDDYGEDDRLVKRVSKWRFLLKFAKLLAKFGKRALTFFECTGINAAWKCSDEFFDCAVIGQAPWNCIEGLVCIGGSAWGCR